MAGVPYVTDDPGTPERSKYEINLVSQAVRITGDTAGVSESVEVNYGITDHFQSHVYLPLAFDAPDGSKTRFGTGDVEIGFKYRFFDGGDLFGWDVGTAPSVIVPPGGFSHHFGTGRTHAFLPLLVARHRGAWSMFAEAGYGINPGRDNRNWTFAGAAVAYDISPRITVGGELLYSGAAAIGVRDGLGFNLTTTYNLSGMYHLLLSMGRNFTHVNDTNQFSTLAGLQLTF